MYVWRPGICGDLVVMEASMFVGRYVWRPGSYGGKYVWRQVGMGAR